LTSGLNQCDVLKAARCFLNGEECGCKVGKSA
jgi:hypothetical protein